VVLTFLYGHDVLLNKGLTEFDVTLPQGGTSSIVMSMSVCLSVRSNNSKTTRPNFTDFILHVSLPTVMARSSDGVGIC